MSNQMLFYTISFENNDSQPTSCSVKDFFVRLTTMYEQKNKTERIATLLRQIGDNSFYLFKSYWNTPSDTRLVIPIGKVKSTNLPVVEDPNTFAPKEINEKLFIISQFVCDFTERIVAINKKRESPTPQDIEDYLNTFIFPELQQKIKIRPIMINKGVEAVRNASLVRGIEISLDLGQSINSFYNQQILDNQRIPLAKSLKALADTSKDVNGKTFKIALGLGQTGKRKTDTLDRNSILSLIEQLDINSSLIKEIVVTYRNGESEPVDYAKLKNSSVQVFHWFNANDSLGSEFLLHNFDEAIDTQRRNYRNARDNYLGQQITYNSDMALLIKQNYRPEDYYE